jgi:hypothetical protein
MESDDETTIAELENRYDNLRRKAKRKPKWRRARDTVAEELVKRKRERVAELEQELPGEDQSPAAVAATNLLQNDSKRTDVAELREEQERHRDDIAELERQ